MDCLKQTARFFDRDKGSTISAEKGMGFKKGGVVGGFEGARTVASVMERNHFQAADEIYI